MANWITVTEANGDVGYINLDMAQRVSCGPDPRNLGKYRVYVTVERGHVYGLNNAVDSNEEAEDIALKLVTGMIPDSWNWHPTAA